MGQDKQQLNHLLNFVKTVYDDPDNKEFAAGIQSMIKQDLQGEKSSWSQKIDDIYEYCLNKNLRAQAEDLYDDFPLFSIKQTLIEDYIKMEEARRKNDFDIFGLHLYQQIENIVNYLAKDPVLEEVVAKMMDAPSLMDTRDNPNHSVKKRYGKKNISSYVLINPDEDKIKAPLAKQYAMDKAYLIMYYVCYGARMTNNQFDDWNLKKDIISDIYSVRNVVHRGGDVSEPQKRRYEEVSAQKSQSYLRFLSGLLFIIEGVHHGYPLKSELVEYARSLKQTSSQANS